MAWKNSAGVKLNDATELIIRADPNGTVESVLNVADGTEYINDYTPLKEASVIINNTSASNRTIYYAKITNGIVGTARTAITAGSSGTITVLKASIFDVSSGATMSVVSGDATIDNNTATVNGDCEINILT